MNIITSEQKLLVGLSIRTCNALERSEETAKIPPLWKTFYETFYKKSLHDEKIYGVYSGYESDYKSYFDVTAAVEKKIIIGVVTNIITAI